MSEIENEEIIEETQNTEDTDESEEELLEQAKLENEFINNEQERLLQEQQEQERILQEQQEHELELQLEQQEQERLQAIQEHEEYLNSFPETTVFYIEIVTRPDGSKALGTPIKNARLAESWGILENHYDESELTYVGTDKCGIWYLKGFEKPAESLEQLQLDRYRLIDSQIEAYLDAKVKEHNYANVVSCVSYYNSTDEKYRAEARAVSEWRDHIYRTGEIVWQSVLDGTVNYEDVDLQYIIGIAGDFTWPEVE